MVKLKHYASSIQGRRDYNQDRYLFKQYTPGTYFFAVADGMGGMNGGEVASSLTLETADKYLTKLTEEGEHWTNLKGILKNLYSLCHKALELRVEEEPELKGMGTTLVCILVSNGNWAAGNLGDSRLYKYSNNVLNQISIDHTYVQDHINKHGDNLNPALMKRYGNVLVKAMDGKGDEPDIFPSDFESWELSKGDQFMLCSDGLILDKMDLETSFFSKTLKNILNLKWKVTKLIDWAYSNGSTDNITALIVKVTGE